MSSDRKRGEFLAFLSGATERRKERREEAETKAGPSQQVLGRSVGNSGKESEFSVRNSLPEPRIVMLFTPTLPPFATSSSISRLSQPHIILQCATPTPPPSQPASSIMERRRGLPTEKGYAPAIPHYISFEQQSSSTGSSGSQDSVITQVPLPYHLPQDHPYNQEINYAPQIEGTTDWATPILPQSSTFTFPPRAQGPNMSLNPTSSPYVPSGYLPATAGPTPLLQQLQQFDSNGFSGNGVAAPNYQQQGQQIGMQQSQNGNPFRPQGNLQFGGPVGGPSSHLQPPFAPTQGPYDHYGAPGGMHGGIHEFTAYRSGPTQMPAYGSNAMGLPEPAYAMMGVNDDYQNMPYGFSAGNGHNQASYSPMFTGSNNGVHLTRAKQLPKSAANANYGVQVPPYFPNDNGNQAVGASQPGIHQSSNLATAPVLSYGGKTQQGGNTQLGGPVLAPSKSVRAASPTKSIASTRGSSRGRGSISSIEDLIKSPGITPKLTQALGLEFSSEPRTAPTPRLRSRRHQSISDISTDPARRNSTAAWLDNAPTLENLSLQDNVDKRRPSPPKMLSLLAAGGVDASTLSPINEHDRSAGIRPRPMSNRFAPITALSGPIGGLVGQPQGMSNQLRLLTDGGQRKPTIEEAFDPRNLPFIEYCRNLKVEEWGVIKIKNIPYSVNRPEVLAFLGRNARIVNEQDNEPVHIIMERVTSKTLDCYVEFVNFNEAVNAVNRFETNRVGGRGGRLGQRHVEVELSTQEQLMKDLFPKAKNVKWHGAHPEIIPRDPNDPYNSGFQGFVSREELVMLVKHVESPQRSPFSKDCPQRPFECLVSTLLKYPWQMVDYITIEDRNLLHKATKELLCLLVDRVANEKDNVHLSHMLLKRVYKAALKCPGFSQSMKDDVVFICGVDDQTARDNGVLPFGSYWYHLWCVGPKPGVPDDYLLWYCAIIREATESKQQLTLAEQAARGEQKKEIKLFGDLDKHIEYGKGLAHQTLSQVAHAEWTAIEKVLRMALTPAIARRESA